MENEARHVLTDVVASPVAFLFEVGTDGCLPAEHSPQLQWKCRRIFSKTHLDQKSASQKEQQNSANSATPQHYSVSDTREACWLCVEREKAEGYTCRGVPVSKTRWSSRTRSLDWMVFHREEFEFDTLHNR